MAAILANCRGYQIEDKVDGTVSEQVKNGLRCSLVICDHGKVQELMRLQLLGDKKANKTENMTEIVFLRGVSEIQCLVYQQDNVNPFEICNNWIQLNMVFHVIIIFCRKYVNLISASDFSDFMHN